MDTAPTTKTTIPAATTPTPTTTTIDKVAEEKEKKGNILEVTTAEQFKTVGELFEHSRPNSVYYTLLILSIFIVVTGLLLGNAPIVIGGMLVTPVLTPILVIALGITVGELKAVKTPVILILKSIFITIIISALLTLAFGVDTTEVQQILVNNMRTAILYFIVASASGIAATFAWVRKDIADIMPGISIAVSLIPPLSLIGIQLGALEFESARFFLLIFILNFVGILMGALIVFSLLKFQKSGWEVQRQIHEIEKVEEAKEAKKTAEKTQKTLEQVKKNVEQVQALEEEKAQTTEQTESLDEPDENE